VQVQVVSVEPHQHRLLAQLYHLYLHDLSAFSRQFQLNDQGIWQPDYLPDWLGGLEGAHRFLILADDAPVGFALVGQTPFPYKDPRRDLCLAEFFVLRSHRGHRIGSRAARAIFDRLRGRWELSVLQNNLPALRFWRWVIAEYSGGVCQEHSAAEGPVFWVENGPSSSTDEL